jgi:hypothetical protein
VAVRALGDGVPMMDLEAVVILLDESEYDW